MKNFVVFSILSLILMGCRKPDPAPEMRDPIYSSIKKDLKKAEGSLKEAETEFEENKSNLDKIEPYTRQSKTFWGKYWRSEKKVRKAKQKVHFLNLHLINRKYAAKNSYIRAFNAKAEDSWPSPNTINRYKLNKRLKNAPRKWNSENIARQLNDQK